MGNNAQQLSNDHRPKIDTQRMMTDFYNTLRSGKGEELVGVYHGANGSGDLSLMRKVAAHVTFDEFARFLLTRKLPENMPALSLTQPEMEVLKGGSDLGDVGDVIGGAGDILEVTGLDNAGHGLQHVGTVGDVIGVIDAIGNIIDDGWNMETTGGILESGGSLVLGLAGGPGWWITPVKWTIAGVVGAVEYYTDPNIHPTVGGVPYVGGSNDPTTAAGGMGALSYGQGTGMGSLGSASGVGIGTLRASG